MAATRPLPHGMVVIIVGECWKLCCLVDLVEEYTRQSILKDSVHSRIYGAGELLRRDNVD